MKQLQDFRFYGRLALAEGAKPSEVQLMKTGTFFHALYGKFTITAADIGNMVKNFGVVRPKAPTEMVIDYEHASTIPGQKAPAAGWIKSIRQLEDALYGTISWTEDAAAAIKADEYRYISPEFNLEYTDKETGKKVGPTLISAALTNRPFLEGMQPVVLSDELAGSFALSEHAMKLYSEDQERDDHGRFSGSGGGGDSVTHAGGTESKKALQAEAQGAAKVHTQMYGKSSSSQGREGQVHIVDGTPHAVIEDNGSRGIFQSIGKTSAGMSIKPTTVADFKDTKALDETPEEMMQRNMTMSEWSTAFIDDLPDSSFAYVEDGEKDDQGKTTPRGKRHLPFKGPDGEVDLPHLRDALSRLDQTDLPSGGQSKARGVLEAAAKKAGIDTQDKKTTEENEGMKLTDQEVEALQAKALKLTEAEASLSAATVKLAEANTKLTAANKTILGREADAAVAKALAGGKILPKAVEWAKNLYLTDQAQFEGFIAVAGLVGPALGAKGSDKDAEGGNISLSEVDVKMAEQMNGHPLNETERAAMIAAKKSLITGDK